MTREQAVDMLRKMASLYQNNCLKYEEAREQYIAAVLPMRYDVAQKAIEKCTFESKYCPTIADIKYKYNETLKSMGVSIEQVAGHCKVCLNKGIVLVTKDTYTYAAYCTQCERGNKFKYVGNNCVEHKTDYYIPPLTEFCTWGEFIQKRDICGVADLGGEVPYTMYEERLEQARQAKQAKGTMTSQLFKQFER